MAQLSNVLLSILLVLHVIWTYFILKIVYKFMYSGKVRAVFNNSSYSILEISQMTRI